MWLDCVILIQCLKIQKMSSEQVFAWANDVATLNQRDWRWFNIATTLCARWVKARTLFIGRVLYFPISHSSEHHLHVVFTKLSDWTKFSGRVNIGIYVFLLGQIANAPDVCQRKASHYLTRFRFHRPIHFVLLYIKLCISLQRVSSVGCLASYWL